MFALPRHVMNRRPFNRTMLHCHNTHGFPFLHDGSKVRNRRRTRRTSISSAPTSITSQHEVQLPHYEPNFYVFFFSVLLLLSFCWVEMFYGAVSWTGQVAGLTFGRGIARIPHLYVVLFSLFRVGCDCFLPYPFQFIIRQWSGLRCHAVWDVPCPNVSGGIVKKSVVACLTAGVTEWLWSIIKTADKTASLR